ncbi:hypothetical protein MKX29_13375 [Cytobacillus sp. FSL R7-0696]|uniref:hypothetical protein n=1 Tax=Cytobacillus sp. FSL R7-0696 TaxID=2921691 RepID=UPI0030F88C20
MQSFKVNLFPYETIIINQTQVDYGEIPSGLIDGYIGTVFYFKTSDAFDKDTHESAIKPLIKQLQSASEDYGTSLELSKCEALIWKEYRQVTVASFRIRDIY